MEQYRLLIMSDLDSPRLALFSEVHVIKYCTASHICVYAQEIKVRFRRRPPSALHLVLVMVLIQPASLCLFNANTEAHWFCPSKLNSISSNLSYDSRVRGALTSIWDR